MNQIDQSYQQHNPAVFSHSDKHDTLQALRLTPHWARRAAAAGINHSLQNLKHLKLIIVNLCIQNAIEAHKNRPFRWETQISPVPTYGIPSHHLRRS